MAGILAHAVTGVIDCAASTPVTLVQIVAAANHRVKVTGFGVYGSGVAAADNPILVQVIRQTSAGTMSALTPLKNDNDQAETLQTTAQHTASAEPTSTDIIYQGYIHPQAGWQVMLPYGQEIVVPGGTRLGIKVSPGAAPAAGPNLVAQITFEE